MPWSMAVWMSLTAFVGVGLLADVEAAEADGRDGLARGAELAVDHVWGLRAGGCAGGGGDWVRALVVVAATLAARRS